MNVSGDQKYYLVFKSPNKEIRIPEYDPKGFFEVDKVNGCILFKITKKNAEDILGMKTAGERIFYIIRVYEETDAFGKVLSVTDEVEVYHGKWGDDEAFTTFTTENKVDLLTKSLAAQLAKNETQMGEYTKLLNQYNDEIKKYSDLEKEVESLRAQNESLQTQISEYVGATYDGNVLSTDTKYIAFEDTLENVTFTEEQYEKALGELMTKGEVDLTDDVYTNDDKDDPKINLDVKVEVGEYGIEVSVYKNDSGDKIGRAMYGLNFNKTNDIIENGTKYVFEYTAGDVKDVVKPTQNGDIITSVYMQLEFVTMYPELNNAVSFQVGKQTFNKNAQVKLNGHGDNITVIMKIDDIIGENSDDDISAIGLIGQLKCRIKYVESESTMPV
jgi:hypothetical protein